MTVLGRGIDELDVEGLEVRSTHRCAECLAKSEDSFLGADNTALDHQPVLVDLAVVGEAAHGGDSLLRDVRLGRGGLVVSLSTNTQDTLVDLSSMEVSELTSSGNANTDAGRMPSSDAGDVTR